MRVHAIHVQGLLRPRGVRRLTLEPGYNLIVAPEPEDCAGLRAALEALLYPESALAGVEPWIDRAGDAAPRAGMVLTLGSQTLRVIADLAVGRLHLGRYDSASRSYQRVSTDPAEIEALLSKSGLPERAALLRERGFGWDPARQPARAEPFAAPSPAEEPAPPVEVRSASDPPHPRHAERARIREEQARLGEKLARAEADRALSRDYETR